MFPRTSVLDDGQRIDEAPLSNGGQWSQMIPFGLQGALRLVSNLIQPHPTVQGQYASYWNAAQFGPTEMWCTMGAAESGNDALDLLWRMDTPGGATFNGYQAIYRWVDGLFTLYRVDVNTRTGLKSARTPSLLVTGDSLGIRHVGPTITAYVKYGAGNWQLVNSASDNTYTSGYIGLEMDQFFSPGIPAMKISQFGGGAVQQASYVLSG